MKIRFPGRPPFACVLVLAATGCASGSSYLQSAAKQIHALDGAAVVVGTLLVLENPDAGWTAEVVESDKRRFRIAITRAAWSGSGEGEFGVRFGKEAERVAASHACSGFRIESYRERYDSLLVGSTKVAEGIIQCL